MQHTEGHTQHNRLRAEIRQLQPGGIALGNISHPKKTLQAMTLIELMVTVTIMAVLLAISTPALAALQSRQALVTAQREVQAALYSLNQHTLSPPQNNSNNYIVVGYGLAFLQAGDSSVTNGGNCVFSNTSKRDLMVLYKLTVSNSFNIGQIVPVFNPLDPGDTCQVKVSQYPDDIFSLPPSIHFNKSMIDNSGGEPNVPFGGSNPWLVAMPLYSAGDEFGTALTSDFKNVNFSDPLPQNDAAANQTIVLKNAGIRVNGSYLCRTVTIKRSTNGFEASSKSLDQCTGS